MQQAKVNKQLKSFQKLRLFRRHLLWRFAALRYQFKFSGQNLVFVTGCDFTHFKSLIQLLRSIQNAEPNSKVITYDFGWSEAQVSELKLIMDSWSNLEVRRFQFEKFPSYFNMKINGGQYAWKPIIIQEVSKETNDFVLYCDAGNVIDKRLTWVRKIINRDGIYCPTSSGTVNDWTHVGMLDYYRFSSRYLRYKNLNAAVIGFDPNMLKITQLLDEWADCALTQKCIAPEGSSRENHRFDQSALTLLAYRIGLVKRTRSTYLNRMWEPIGLRIQQDID
jgi:hypothetical protein